MAVVVARIGLAESAAIAFTQVVRAVAATFVISWAAGERDSVPLKMKDPDKMAAAFTAGAWVRVDPTRLAFDLIAFRAGGRGAGPEAISTSGHVGPAEPSAFGRAGPAEPSVSSHVYLIELFASDRARPTWPFTWRLYRPIVVAVFGRARPTWPFAWRLNRPIVVAVVGRARLIFDPVSGPSRATSTAVVGFSDPAFVAVADLFDLASVGPC